MSFLIKDVFLIKSFPQNFKFTHLEPESLEKKSEFRDKHLRFVLLLTEIIFTKFTINSV